MTLRQSKPSFKIEIVLDLFELAFTDEKAGEEVNHQLDHVLADRIFSRLEFINYVFELLLTIRAILPSRFEGRGDLLDVLDVFSDFLWLGLDCVQTSVDAASQAAELLFSWKPLFSRPNSVGATRGPHSKLRPFAGRADGEALPDRH